MGGASGTESRSAVGFSHVRAQTFPRPSVAPARFKYLPLLDASPISRPHPSPLPPTTKLLCTHSPPPPPPPPLANWAHMCKQVSAGVLRSVPGRGPLERGASRPLYRGVGLRGRGFLHGGPAALRLGAGPASEPALGVLLGVYLLRGPINQGARVSLSQAVGVVALNDSILLQAVCAVCGYSRGMHVCTYV